MYRPSVCFFSCLLLAACATHSGADKGIDSLTGAEQYSSLEIAQTVEQQAENQIRDTPTVFFVALDDDRHAWDRARIFFEKYLQGDGGKSSLVTKVVGSRWGLASSPNSGSYTFEVWKEPVNDGYRYTVQCAPKPKGTQQVAVLNAQNLARFIKEGRLEISQLVR